MIPKYAFLTKGVGISKEKLTSFEMSLRDAGIAEYNIVKVSSICHRNVKLFQKKKA